MPAPVRELDEQKRHLRNLPRRAPACNQHPEERVVSPGIDQIAFALIPDHPFEGHRNERRNHGVVESARIVRSAEENVQIRLAPERVRGKCELLLCLPWAVPDVERPARIVGKHAEFSALCDESAASAVIHDSDCNHIILFPDQICRDSIFPLFCPVKRSLHRGLPDLHAVEPDGVQRVDISKGEDHLLSEKFPADVQFTAVPEHAVKIPERGILPVPRHLDRAPVRGIQIRSAPGGTRGGFFPVPFQNRPDPGMILRHPFGIDFLLFREGAEAFFLRFGHGVCQTRIHPGFDPGSAGAGLHESDRDIEILLKLESEEIGNR